MNAWFSRSASILKVVQLYFISDLVIKRDRLRFTSLDEPAGDLLKFDLVLDGNVKSIVEQGPADFLLVNVILSRHWQSPSTFSDLTIQILLYSWALGNSLCRVGRAGRLGIKWDKKTCGYHILYPAGRNVNFHSTFKFNP